MLLASKLLLATKLLLASGLTSELLLTAVSIELLLRHVTKLLLVAILLLPAGLLHIRHLLLLHSRHVLCLPAPISFPDAAPQHFLMTVQRIASHGMLRVALGLWYGAFLVHVPDVCLWATSYQWLQQ